VATILLNGGNLTLEQVIAVAYSQPGDPQITLGETAQAKVKRAAEAVARFLEKGIVAYGITTGFGVFKDRIISADQVEQLQRNILLSHAVGVGDPLDIPTTRALMLIRANTLAQGHSGIRLATLQLLIDLLNAGVHPVIPEKGSLGASGDLAPLAHMSLVLIGEGEAEVQGQVLSGAAALRQANLQPVTLAAKEGLALTNGTAVMCALGALAVHRAERLSRVADIAGCLSLEALNGTPLAFDARIHHLRPYPHQQECAANLRALLADSDFTRRYDPTNIQDAYTLRCIPQVHGAARGAIAHARSIIETELNAVTDNPLLFLDETSEEVTVLSGGNFHGEPLALVLDYLAIAVSELGNISERRVMRLLDAASNGNILPPALIRNAGVNSGLMLLQYTAAALLAENKVLAHPASVDSIPTSANVEDHVSLGQTAALKARQIVENVEYILALELLAAAQGLDFRREALGTTARLGRGTKPVYELIRRCVPFIEQDEALYPHIAAVQQLVTNGEITR